MVEHNLAKVRVAGSSPVFRSTLREEVDARMVESVDTKDLKSFGHCGCAGSSPASSTGLKLHKSMIYGAFFICCFEFIFLSHRYRLLRVEGYSEKNESCSFLCLIFTIK